MALEKEKVRKYALAMVMFVVGMLSVSISNLFGGFYCSVVAIEVVLLTLYVYSAFDIKEKSKFDIIDLSLVASVTVFEILFFIINDIFGVDVYVKNDLNFLGVLVIISQMLCIASIIYMSVYQVVSLKHAHVEVIEKNDMKEAQKDEETTISETEKNQTENVEIETEDVELQQEENIKSIAENNVKVEAPFMEEAK